MLNVNVHIKVNIERRIAVLRRHHHLRDYYYKASPLPPARSLARPAPWHGPHQMDGRVRSRPHAVGLWACTVYLNVTLEEESRAPLDAMVRALIAGNAGLADCAADGAEGAEGARASRTMHMSLSRTFYAKHWHLEGLLARLGAAFAPDGRLAPLPPITFDAFGLFVNDERTRSFLALCTDALCNETVRRPAPPPWRC